MKKIIEDFVPLGGAHCITNSLKQVFYYYGYPLSEAMMFGLASGLSFLYLNQSQTPMINGRTKVFEFEQKLAQRLQIKLNCQASKNYDKVLTTTRQLLDENQPVLIYVDMPYLKYLGMDENSHFGGHAVVLFGYDDQEKVFYVSDRDNCDYPVRVPRGTMAMDFHKVSFEELEKARSSNYRPFPASNKYVTIDFTGYRAIDKAVLQEAIRETCDTMMNPPAHLLGIKGIEKFSKEIKKWKNFSPQKLRLAGTTNYFQISKDGGTGGGIFRQLYGDFLIEAASILKDENYLVLGKEFHEVACLWDELANDLWKLSMQGDPTILPNLADKIVNIYEREVLLYTTLKQLVDIV